MNTVDFCRALADETRQAILKQLQERVELCVSDIVGSFDKSQPAISHHLNILQQTGLVRARRDGRQIYYSVDAENLVECCGRLWSKFEPIQLTEIADAEPAPKADSTARLTPDVWPAIQAIETVSPPVSVF